MIKCEFENGHKDFLRHLAVHCLVIKNKQILLTKRADNMNEGGKWAVPGGFVQFDETAEEAACRELKEETGWKAEIIEMLRINTNPNRPGEDRQIVITEYIMKPLEKIGESDGEVTDLQWFDLDKLPLPHEMAFDHGESIELYKKYQREKFPLPLWRGI